MKLKEGFLTHQSGGEHYLVPTGGTEFSGLVRSNESAAKIIEGLRRETTKEKLTALLLEEYDIDEKTAAKDVERVLDTLRSIGALDE